MILVLLIFFCTLEASNRAPLAVGESRHTYGRAGDASPVITKFKVTSRRNYTVSTAAVGELVYTDSTFRWTHLKPFLSGANQYIATADSDAKTMLKEMITFTLTKKPAFVLVFLDSRVKSLPLWMVEEV